MMAAIAAKPAKVVIIEKNDSLGRKLLLTGGGRCNLTQAEFDDRKFIEALGPKGKFLFSSISSFGPKETIDFFRKIDVPTKIERASRVFPRSDRATDVLTALTKELSNARILLSEQVIDFDGKTIILKDKKIEAKAFILATGGKSYPSTGSTGDGYEWAKKLGHTIVDPKPALSAVKTEEEWVKNLRGLSFPNTRISAMRNGKRKASIVGEMIFTHFGISGPAVINLSKKVGELMTEGLVLLEIDLIPDIDYEKMDAVFQKKFHSSKNVKNLLSETVPARMADQILNSLKIDEEKEANKITRTERKNIISALKATKLTVKELDGFNGAMVTSGGIELGEIDSRTMQSKINPNLFFAGEIIDLDGPTGGYNLQICWSTGYAAGKGALESIE